MTGVDGMQRSLNDERGSGRLTHVKGGKGVGVYFVRWGEGNKSMVGGSHPQTTHSES